MAQDGIVADLLDRLETMGDVTVRRMFGGHGIYHRGQMFAIVDEGRVYFKVDEALKAEFVALGSGPFVYAPGKKISTYFEVPLDILEETPALVDAARRSASAALAMKAAKTKGKVQKRPPRVSTR